MCFSLPVLLADSIPNVVAWGAVSEKIFVQGLNLTHGIAGGYCICRILAAMAKT